MSEKENTNAKSNEDLREEEINGDQQQEQKADSVDEAKQEIEPTLEEKYAELNNKYIRLYSDFDNFRKRTIKEKADIISTANGSLMMDLIETLDDFERAIVNNDNVDDLEGLREGFKLIYNKFSTTLKNKGLEAMECKGDVFDADKHEAITNIPVENKADKGKIIDVIERGYNLRGKALRYAKVVVGQ